MAVEQTVGLPFLRAQEYNHVTHTHTHITSNTRALLLKYRVFLVVVVRFEVFRTFWVWGFYHLGTASFSIHVFLLQFGLENKFNSSSSTYYRMN